MTKFPSRAAIAALIALAGCSHSSGVPAAAIVQPDVAAAYLPLHRSIHLGIDSIEGAAMLVAPGIAVTNAHNANLVDPKAIVAQSEDYDLLFFRKSGTSPPMGPLPAPGGALVAYGQGADGELRIAHGVMREVKNCAGCDTPAWFTFAGDAGPGFSGGPVLDAQGRLVGITFGYKDEGRTRLIYAYDMARVRAEMAALHVR